MTPLQPARNRFVALHNSVPTRPIPPAPLRTTRTTRITHHHPSPRCHLTTTPVPRTKVFVAGGRAVITHRLYPGPGASAVRLANWGADAVRLEGFEGFNLERYATAPCHAPPTPLPRPSHARAAPHHPCSTPFHVCAHHA